MKWTMTTISFTGFLLLCNIAGVCAGGTGIMRLLSYENPTQKLASGQCCDQTRTTNCSRNQCDPKFIVCLYQQLDSKQCSLGREESYVFNDTSIVTFNDTFGESSNPLHFNFSSWKMGFVITVAVVDFDADGTSDTMDIMIQSEDVDLAAGAVHDGLSLKGTRGMLHLEFSIECDPGYYGDCSSPPPPQDEDNTAVVVGAAVGGGTVLLLVLVSAWYFLRKYIIKRKTNIGTEKIQSTDKMTGDATSSPRDGTTVMEVVNGRPD
ncbi:uncharacterized protein LOC117322524 [Pecten maximus]|uniref:uncharacterized protein LOC117322524 n=1 Tax=Pecten maximus TaxID=6579 RepID=UPI0014590B28|nr:uncharacterized protein LOC117322524 [Pecten maximus]